MYGRLKDVLIIILFDTGASHSFISTTCVHTLELPIQRAESGLVVPTPLGGSALVNQVYPNL